MKRSFNELLSDVDSSSESDVEEILLPEFDAFVEQDEDVSVNILNKHERDDEIFFDEPTHIYTDAQGNKFPGSITGVKAIATYGFDGEKTLRFIFWRVPTVGYEKDPWNKRVTSQKSKYMNHNRFTLKSQWKKTRDDGTYMHNTFDQCLSSPNFKFKSNVRYEDLEKFYYRETTFDRPDLKPLVAAFLTGLVSILRRNWKPYRTEWRIFSNKYRVAGSIDAVFSRVGKHGAIEYLLVDWKCNDKSFDETHGEDYLLAPFMHVKATKAGEYGIQLNLYSVVLLEYGIQITHQELHQFTTMGKHHPHTINLDIDSATELLQIWLDYHKFIDTMSNPETAAEFLKVPSRVSFEYHPYPMAIEEKKKEKVQNR